jgi:nicotinamide-nucleotide amidase
MDNKREIEKLAYALVNELISAGKLIAVAESCTGGWISKALTDVSGSSQCFGFGMVTYSNAAKMTLLGVNAIALEEFGAVSEEVVAKMVTGTLETSGADFAVAVSGIAGPDGGTIEKPVGTVWVAWALRTSNGPIVERAKLFLSGNRQAIREQTVLCALQGVRERLRALRKQ